MIDLDEVLETNKMIERENLDVRTVTMGISLMECCDPDLDSLNEKIYDKIVSTARDLIPVAEDISLEYGIPIVNKRVSVTPISIVGSSACRTPDDFITIAHTLERAAKKIGINFIGGYSALVAKGMTRSDLRLWEARRGFAVPSRSPQRR